MLEHKILGRDFPDNVVLKFFYEVIFTKMTPYVPYGKKIISNQFQLDNPFSTADYDRPLHWNAIIGIRLFMPKCVRPTADTTAHLMSLKEKSKEPIS